MHPFRPPFGVPSQPSNPNAYRPNTPRPNIVQQATFQDYDQMHMSYTQMLNMPNLFYQGAYAGGNQGGEEPEVEVVRETQPDQMPAAPSRSKRSHRKKGETEPRAKKSYEKWSKDDEFALARAWLDVSEDPEIANYQDKHVFWENIRARFFKAVGRGEYRDHDSISGKWKDINSKCHGFQEVYQRCKDNRGSGEDDVGIVTRAMEEYNVMRGPFTYLKIWELLRGSPKWADVPPMGAPSRRRAKRSKTSSSVDPETPSSDARNFDINTPFNVDEEEADEDLTRPPGRRSVKNKGKGRVESSSTGNDLKEDFEEMNRRLQDIRDLGERRLETMRERAAENKKFVAIQEARQMEKDIEFLSKPIDHLTGDAFLLAQMRRQQIKEKYGF